MKQSLKDPELQQEIAKLFVEKNVIPKLSVEKTPLLVPTEELIISELNALVTENPLATGWIESKIEFPNYLHDFPGYYNGVYIGTELKTLYIDFNTKPIILQDINLGRFKITIDILFYPETTIWEINPVALDPNPAANNEKTVHPNINDGSICLGEFGYTFERAFSEGRFGDIYELIINLLNTVSEEPYTHINNWLGTPCVNCGENYDNEESYECVFCGDFGCTTCVQECNKRRCHSTFHPGCGEQCDYCGEKFCDNHIYYDSSSSAFCDDCVCHCNGCNGIFSADKLSDNNFCSECEKISTCSVCSCSIEPNKDQKCPECKGDEDEQPGFAEPDITTIPF